MKEIYKQIAKEHPDKLPAPFDEIYKLVGFEGLDALINFFGGTQVYIPVHKYLFADCIRKQVAKEHNGKNSRELSRKYNISKRTLSRYLYDAS